MEYYLTTYNKDFKWPVPFSSEKSDLLSKHKEETYREVTRQEPCSKYLSKNDDRETGQQLVAPAQTGAPPVGPESKHNQPFTYLRKPEQLAQEVYAHKYTSTYRDDYKEKGFEPLKGWLTQELPKDEEENDKVEVKTSARVEGEPPESTTVKTEEQPPTQPEGHDDENESPYLNAVKSIAAKPATISKMVRPPNMKRKKEEKSPPEYTGGQHPPKLGKWKSEYRDTISRIGGIIIKKKLLANAIEE